MTSSRSLGSCFILALALPACVSRSTVPWPPKDGSCIAAHTTGSGMRLQEHFTIQGHEAKRDDVRRLVARSPWAYDHFRHYRTMNVVSGVLMGTGLGATFGGFLAGQAASRPALYAISLVGLVVTGIGIALAATNEDPFREAVWQYNEQAAR